MTVPSTENPRKPFKINDLGRFIKPGTRPALSRVLPVIGRGGPEPGEPGALTSLLRVDGADQSCIIRVLKSTGDTYACT